MLISLISISWNASAYHHDHLYFTQLLEQIIISNNIETQCDVR